MATRIDRRFAELKTEGRAALVTFLTAGDPDPETSLALVQALPAAGADVIELGMPFTDPMADGPAIQAVVAARAQGRADHEKDARAGARLPQAATTRRRSCSWVTTIRSISTASIASSGMRNPPASTASSSSTCRRKRTSELCLPALKAGLNFIRLATPTTDDKRLPAVLANTSGFVYYVSITGITGAAAPDAEKRSAAVARIKRHTELPVAVGFGVRTAEQAARIASRRRWRGGRLGAGGAVLKGSLDPDERADREHHGQRGDRSGRANSPAACALRAGKPPNQALPPPRGLPLRHRRPYMC